MTSPPWTVEFFAREDEPGKVRQVLLDEMRDELTEKQFAVVLRQIKRLEEHGRQLGPTYFGKVEGINDKL